MSYRVLALVLTGFGAMPGGLWGGNDWPESQPPVCSPPVEKTICTRKVHLIEEQAATTVPKLALREVEVCRDKATTLEIGWREERHVCTELVVKPREIEQEVTCTEMKPVATTDPCTGQACTVYQQVPVVKRVKITVYDAVPQPREYVVKVPCLKPIEKDVMVKKLALDASTEPAIEKRLRAVTTTCEIKVSVPGCALPCPSK